jgi:iron only hydrogenase large subunit-like protein
MKDETSNYVDVVITTRELARMIRHLGIDFNGLEPEPSDTAYGMRSSAGNLFGVSGGHLEGLLRTVQHQVTGTETNSLKIPELRGLKNKKEARIKVGKHSIQVLAVNGLANAKAMTDDIPSGRTDYQLIEVMACPFGCINGGGQKLNSEEKNLKSRMKALYDVDDEEMIRVAHKNHIINDIYNKFLARPTTGQKNEMLHVSRQIPDKP